MTKYNKKQKVIRLYDYLWAWLQSQADILTAGNVTAFLENLVIEAKTKEENKIGE